MSECSNDELEKLVSTLDFRAYKENLYDFQATLCQESEMFKFWHSFLMMVENLLCILYATRTGDWTLYVESLHTTAKTMHVI